MKSEIRVLKRRQREELSGSNPAENGQPVKRENPETIVKGWITALRERRKVEDEDYQRGFLRYDENLALLGL
jgi:hypothetical protein